MENPLLSAWKELLSLFRRKSKLLAHLPFGFQYTHFTQRCSFQERQHQGLVIRNGHADLESERFGDFRGNLNDWPAEHHEHEIHGL